MRVILWTNMFCSKSLDDAKRYSRKAIQYAPHLFQNNLLEGLYANNASVSVLSIPPIGSFPFSYKKIRIPGYKWDDNNNQIGYLNIPWIKKKVQTDRLIKKTREILQENRECCLIIYSLNLPFLLAASELKKQFPSLRVFVIQTDAVPGRNDMPKYMGPQYTKLGNRLVSLAKCCDGFIILTKYLEEPLEADGRPVLVLECICDNTSEASPLSSGERHICLYTGSLNKEYGICEMVDAFKCLPNAILWICGKGNSEDYIKSAAIDYPNIKYFGFVDQSEISNLRNQCDYLINPRRPKGTYTLYSFPSKTAEYMVSGKPVIMYKLEGIPDEYDEYLNYLHGTNGETIAKDLAEIFSMDYNDLCEKGLRGRQFMLEKKGKQFQAKRVLDFIIGG